tara:strand:+ start:552 stop:779 length:228 start_codon:yes stop_codon:yes gene_type:complete
MGELNIEPSDGILNVQFKKHANGETIIVMEYTVNNKMEAKNRDWPVYIDTQLGNQMGSLQNSLANRPNIRLKILR